MRRMNRYLLPTVNIEVFERIRSLTVDQSFGCVARRSKFLLVFFNLLVDRKNLMRHPAAIYQIRIFALSWFPSAF
jgi:hypothetical protein